MRSGAAIFFHPPLKGEGRTAQRFGEGSIADASVWTPTRRAALADLPLSGGGER